MKAHRETWGGPLSTEPYRAKLPKAGYVAEFPGGTAPGHASDSAGVVESISIGHGWPWLP